MHEYRTEFKLVRWGNPETLAAAMQEEVNEGWRVDTTTKLSASGETGWTIFSKTTKVLPDIMEARMPLSKLWDILNSTAVFEAKRLRSKDFCENPVADEISKQAKEYYNKFAKEMQ
jgi:hypothetical protein